MGREVQILTTVRLNNFQSMIEQEVAVILSSSAVDIETVKINLVIGIALENISQRFLLNLKKTDDYKNLTTI